jgi:hypothetical protein
LAQPGLLGHPGSRAETGKPVRSPWLTTTLMPVTPWRQRRWLSGSASIQVICKTFHKSAGVVFRERTIRIALAKLFPGSLGQLLVMEMRSMLVFMAAVLDGFDDQRTNSVVEHAATEAECSRCQNPSQAMNHQKSSYGG